MHLDFDKYLSYLDDSVLSIDEKKELIQTVWRMLESHVYMAFHDDQEPPVSDRNDTQTPAKLEHTSDK